MGIFGFNPEQVFLRRDLIRDCMTASDRKAFEDIGSSWFVPNGADAKAFPSAPSRSTVYNWVSKGFPDIETGRSRYSVLAFCAQFDVDPLALFDYRKNGYFSHFARLRMAVQRGLNAMGAFGPIFELLEPLDEWPSDILAKTYWGHPWFNSIFDNQKEYKSTDYALLNVRFKTPTRGAPRAVHIAYRRWDTRDSDDMWRYYGTVIAIEDRLELYNEGSSHLKMHRKDNDLISFRTYFGGRPVEFKIASLHDFDMETHYPFDDMSVIGFNW